MSNKSILITGGAGFIGLHLARSLLASGHDVYILDNFSNQVHDSQSLPQDLIGHVRLFTGDIRDRELIKRAIKGVESVVHLAAETGTGQSMYELDHYFSVNVQGTAGLLDVLSNDIEASGIRNVVLASSRAVYGEGAYLCSEHGVVYPAERTQDRLQSGLFEPLCPICGAEVALCPTSEESPLRPASIYGLTKQVQEQAVLLFGKMRGIGAFGLRFQNVYGPGQSLKNPYTGLLAVFSNLARQNRNLDVYEDGQESRDFVYITDVVNSLVRAVEFDKPYVGALNVGSGRATDVLTVAKEIKNFFGSSSQIDISGKFRVGDIRHNIADIRKAADVLGYHPVVDFKSGLKSFLEWASGKEVYDQAYYLRSLQELSDRDLMGSGTITKHGETE